MPLAGGLSEEWTLCCACGTPPTSSRWSWSELKLYAVSNLAHDRGYGPAEEVMPVNKKSYFSGLYGVAVYFFMNRVVVPLSGAIKYPFSLQMMVIGVVMHIFCIGLPIALMVQRYSIQ
jgi:hypothetical protein